MINARECLNNTLKEYCKIIFKIYETFDSKEDIFIKEVQVDFFCNPTAKTTHHWEFNIGTELPKTDLELYNYLKGQEAFLLADEKEVAFGSETANYKIAQFRRYLEETQPPGKGEFRKVRLCYEQAILAAKVSLRDSPIKGLCVAVSYAKRSDLTTDFQVKFSVPEGKEFL